MSAAEPLSAPVVLRHSSGRVRVHLPAWDGTCRLELEAHARHLVGVRDASASAMTRNVLVKYDASTTTRREVLRGLSAWYPATDVPLPEQSTGRGDRRLDSKVRKPADLDSSPPVVADETDGHHGSAEIAVRGLDRSPTLAARLVRRLGRLPNVTAHVSTLTGRVIVDYDTRLVALQDLLLEVARIELPPLPGEDRPEHPLDPTPLYQSVSRTVGALFGLGVISLQRSGIWRARPRHAVFYAGLAGSIGLLQGFPGLRSGMRRVLGPNTAELTAGLAGIVTLTAARSPLGLLFSAVEAGVLLAQVVARREAWRQYQERLAGADEATPGATIHLMSGDHMPLPGHVVEGTGTATGRDGLPRPAAPGSEIAAGAALCGGPFVVDLHAEHTFRPRPRPAPLAPSLLDRYLAVVGPMSLGYAALTLLFTRSPGKAFVAMLLVNPRTALIGAEVANRTADTRALRAGVTIVGTRRGRVIRRPDMLLLDSPRLLSDALEVTGVIPLRRGLRPKSLLALTAGIAAGAGSPWGGCVSRGSPEPVATSNGAFDGDTARADVDGRRFTLGAATDESVLPHAQRAAHRGEYVLALRDDTGTALGVLTLRPRLAPGAEALARCCRRLGVRLAVLPGGDPDAAQRVVHRIGVRLAGDGDDLAAVDAVRRWQRLGAFVAFVSDSMHGAEALAVSDLSIGLSRRAGEPFPSRVDLLASDLLGVAGVIDAGMQRQRVVRDAVLLSLLANGLGLWRGLDRHPTVFDASHGVYITALGVVADS